MSPVPERICPDCGAALPADAPRGLCPQCLMGAALGVRPWEQGICPAPAHWPKEFSIVQI
jgi:hypothetical protein